MTKAPSRCRIYDGHGHVAMTANDARLLSSDPGLQLTSSSNRVPVTEIMSRDVICARPDISRVELAGLMVHDRIGCVPIVDDLARPIGMITKHDLIDREPADPCTARDLMSALVIKLDEHATVAQAAALMAISNVHHVVVVTESVGSLLGVVSSLDIVRWLARNDGLVEGRAKAPNAELRAGADDQDRARRVTYDSFGDRPE